ncbi:N-acetyltransferase [Fulvimarina sp. 2208YS6-2-32]|uniref:N-acetyltransferase n=1 Tax=Fulvimarina uroteuthidis TaxID=3098149 RepID=A0ABU5I0P8_9HYPH|nr:N-acetyltransferase [Fulvimarina sp. 2208YS6-2-32]MDY8108338.1 N-acetyltransferase [Fulvimarina sp. 2208YS6-2-32]
MLHVSPSDLAASSIEALRVLVPAALPAAGYVITAETPAHVPAREALLDRAMGPGRVRKSSEVIRRGRLPADGLAFAATGLDQSLLGTLRLWHVAAGTRDGAPVAALLLGPLAIEPSAQGLGLGGALMRHAVGEAKRLGHGAILLVGDPAYYARFGFSCASTARLAMPGPFEQHRLLALELKAGALSAAGGLIVGTGRAAGSRATRALQLSQRVGVAA